MTTVRPTAVVTLAIRVEELADTGPLRSRVREIEGAPITLTIPATPEFEGAPIQLNVPRQSVTESRQPTERLASIEQSMRFVRQQPDSFFEGAGSTRDVFLSSLEEQRESVLDEIMAPVQRQLGTQGVEARTTPTLTMGEGTIERTPRYTLTLGEGYIERPGAVSGSPPDDRFVRSGVIPISADVEQNSFRVADTCKITLNWRDVPFDPRLVRACAVDVYVGCISPEDYARGVHGQRDPELGQLLSNLAADGRNALPGFTRFFGFVDTWTVEYDGDNGDMVTLECRDLTALFLDTPLSSGTSIDLNKPIDEGLRIFMAGYPTLADIPVTFGNPGSTVKRGPAPSVGQSIPPQSRTRRGRQARAQRTGDQKMSVWDHITDVCVAAGFIPTIWGTELRILDPRTLFLSNGVPPENTRKMVYGRNLSDLKFTRKLQGPTTPTIEVRCYDPSIGRTRWARYPVAPGARASGVLGITDPARPDRVPNPTPSGSREDQRIQTVNVRATNDPVALERVARGLFEQIGRQEIEGSFTTSSPQSWNAVTDEAASGDELSLLSLRAGDPIELLVAPGNASAAYRELTAATLQAMPRERRARFLMDIGWDETVAQRFAALQDAAGFQTVFRVQTVRVSFDAEDGLEVSVDFSNYVTIRDERSPGTSAISPDAPTQSMALRIGPGEVEGQEIQLGTQEFVGEEIDLRAARNERAGLTLEMEEGTIERPTFERRSRQARDRERLAIRELEGAPITLDPNGDGDQ